MRLKPFIALLAFSLAGASAQTPATAARPPAPPPIPGDIASHPSWPVAKPEDVHSIDAIVAAVYACISGPVGKPRDWDRFRSLFLPDARLIAVRVPGAAAPGPAHNDAPLMTVEDYIGYAGPRLESQGFYEHAILNRVEAFANIANVWSTYESRHAADDPKPFARGINSMALMKDGDRYWVVQIFWDSERPSGPIPPKYLPQ